MGSSICRQDSNSNAECVETSLLVVLATSDVNPSSAILIFVLDVL